MTSAQPPSGETPGVGPDPVPGASPTPAPPAGSPVDLGKRPAAGTYEFRGETLDFDPYRFGAPEQPPTAWSPPAGVTPGAAPVPGQRWSPSDDGPPTYSPGDYWGGGASGQPGGPPPGPSYDPGSGPSYPPPTGPPTGSPYPPAGSPYPPAGYVPTGGAPGHPGPRHPGWPHPQASSGYPPPQSDPDGPRGNGIAIAGFVLGAVSLALFFTSYIGILVGIVGLILAIIGVVKAKSRGGRHRGLARWGIVLAVLGIVASSIFFAYLLSRVDFDCVHRAGDNFSQIQECVK